MPSASNQFDLNSAFLDQPKVLAYGLVRGAGNLVLQQELSGKSRVVFVMLGEGAWDSILRIWINRKAITLPNTAIVHFHPGLDGEIGFGMGASSTGGDQHVDSFWSSVAGSFSTLTYSRHAWLALKIAPDPGAPSANLEVLADYQAMKCRVFDASGNQTAFQWTQNPAWWICDFMIRKFILREAKINQPLVAAELARFDWQSFVDAATYYDADIGGGIKRFSDGGLVFLDGGLTADRLLDQKLLLCRSYHLERNGKLSLYPDKTRSSIFTFKSDNVAPLSFAAKKSTLQQGKNQIKASWREISRASGSTDDATRFAIASNTFDHEAHQLAIGARGPGLSVIPKIRRFDLDYGNNTAERVARLCLFQLVRQLGDDVDPNLTYKAPWQFELTGYEDSISVEPGDVVTIDKSLSEEYGGKLVEVLEIEERPDGTRALSGLEYQQNAFGDVAPTQQTVEAPIGPGTGLPVPAGGANFSYRPTTNPLTATDAGSSATLNIAAFTNRIYTNPQADVQYNSGSITALTRDAVYFVDFIDESIENLGPKTVTFRAWTTREQATGFFVGSISTPKAGSGDIVGNNDGGTGGQYTKTQSLTPVSSIATGWNNPANATDLDSNTFADATTVGAILTYEAYGFLNVNSWFTQIALKIKHMLVSLAGGSAFIKYSLDDGGSWITARTISAADGAPVTTTVDLPPSTNTVKVRVRMELPATSTSAGPNTAATVANDASIGTTAWTNPTNAQGAANSTFATISAGASVLVNSQALKATNFGFALPSNATVAGIQVEFNRKGTNVPDDGFGVYKVTGDNAVRIVKGGTIQLTDRSGSPYWSSTPGWVSYGGSTDLWGTTWLFSDINATTFGAAIAAFADNQSTGSCIASIDAVRITVFYTTSGGSTTGRLYQVTQEISF